MEKKTYTRYNRQVYYRLLSTIYVTPVKVCRIRISKFQKRPARKGSLPTSGAPLIVDKVIVRRVPRGCRSGVP